VKLKIEDFQILLVKVEVTIIIMHLVWVVFQRVV